MIGTRPGGSWRARRPAIPVILVATAIVVACSPGDESATTPPAVYAVPYSRQIVASDVIAMSHDARILSMIPRDSAMIVLTHRSADEISALPSVRGVCQSLGTDSTAKVEVYFKVTPAPIDSGTALMQQLGSTHVNTIDGDIIDGYLSAYRLDALQEYPRLSWLDINTCPPMQAAAMSRP